MNSVWVFGFITRDPRIDLNLEHIYIFTISGDNLGIDSGTDLQFVFPHSLVAHTELILSNRP